MDTSDKTRKKTILKWTGRILIYGFALAGFGIVSAWAIFNLGFTKNSGTVDRNNRYLMEIEEMGNAAGSDSSYASSGATQKALDYYKIMCISKFYPVNANLIMEAMKNNENARTIHQMIAAVELYINQDDKMKQEYNSLVKQGESVLSKDNHLQCSKNAFPWMNMEQWESLKAAIVKEKPSIDSAAKAAGIEPRLIVATLIGEQIRLYNTSREVFKSYLGPVKVLVVETKFSLGVTGIKEITAQRIEQYLKNPNSEFYISKKYENLLDFSTDSVASERVLRLTDNKTNYYSYLYAGIMLHQFQKQWQRAGYDISYNAGILATLFNLGFNLSVPKAAPEIGGAKITINTIPYTFGGLAFDFYYSGELADEFPHYNKKFVE